MISEQLAMVGTWFGNHHTMDNVTLRTRLSLHDAHKEVTQGPEDSPNRWRIEDDGVSAKMLMKKCHPSLELPQNLEGSRESEPPE